MHFKPLLDEISNIIFIHFTGAVPGIDGYRRWPIGLTVKCAGDEDNIFNCTYNTTEGRPDACIRSGTITASVSCQSKEFLVHQLQCMGFDN